VTLARRVDDLATQIRNHSTEIRSKSAAIPTTERQGLTVDEFCALRGLKKLSSPVASSASPGWRRTTSPEWAGG
jgi:hypothetical protein